MTPRGKANEQMTSFALRSGHTIGPRAAMVISQITVAAVANARPDVIDRRRRFDVASQMKTVPATTIPKRPSRAGMQASTVWYWHARVDVLMLAGIPATGETVNVASIAQNGVAGNIWWVGCLGGHELCRS